MIYHDIHVTAAAPFWLQVIWITHSTLHALFELTSLGHPHPCSQQKIIRGKLLYGGVNHLQFMNCQALLILNQKGRKILGWKNVGMNSRKVCVVKFESRKMKCRKADFAQSNVRKIEKAEGRKV